MERLKTDLGSYWEHCVNHQRKTFPPLENGTDELVTGEVGGSRTPQYPIRSRLRYGASCAQEDGALAKQELGVRNRSIWGLAAAKEALESLSNLEVRVSGLEIHLMDLNVVPK